MIEGNTPRVIREMAQATHCLDIGGWYKPIRSATHVLDINPFDTRLQHAAYDPELPERHSRETWLQLDICDHRPWPYPDKFFDFAVCSHVLEDIRDPIWVVSEMARVSKAGYVETPSAVGELLTAATFTEYLFGRRNTVGSSHHRWLVEMDPSRQEILFRMKPYDLGRRHQSVPHTRLHTPDPKSLTVAMFWQGELKAREEVFDLYQWIEATATTARRSVTFEPLKRLKAKLGRVLAGGAPVHVEEMCDKARYPYQ
jgi:hypothetical protein